MEKEKTFEEIRDSIIELLEDKKYMKAREMLISLNSVDAAEVVEEVIDELDIERAIILYRMLPKDTSVDVFSYLDSDDQLAIVDSITDKERNYIIAELDFDDMIDVLEELPANIVDKIIEKSTREERAKINTFLNYSQGSAGSLMTPDYISLQKNMTIRQALDHIKKEGMDSETIYTCYVKDKGRKLIGIISLRALVTSEDDQVVGDLMNEDFVYIDVDTDQEEVAESFHKYGFLAIPVVDKEFRLVGIITIDDIFNVIEEEATEDFERMAGVIDPNTQEYFDMSVMKHVKTQLPWLILLMISAMVTGYIIRSFELMLSTVISLAVYLPLLMGTGGNSGSQAATLVIRGMAVGDIELKDFIKVLWKELRVSFIIGMALSTLNFAKITLIDHEPISVALTVCVSMILVVMLAKIIGGLLPMMAKRIGIDPALMAAPMISSLTDIFSCLTYFSIGAVILGL